MGTRREDRISGERFPLPGDTGRYFSVGERGDEVWVRHDPETHLLTFGSFYEGGCCRSDEWRPVPLAEFLAALGIEVGGA